MTINSNDRLNGNNNDMIYVFVISTYRRIEYIINRIIKKYFLFIEIYYDILYYDILNMKLFMHTLIYI